MSRLLDSVIEFIDRHLKEKSIDKADKASGEAIRKAALEDGGGWKGLKPSAALNAEAIKYIIFRVARALTGSDDLKYACDDIVPYAVLISSYIKHDAAKYDPVVDRQLAEESFQMFYATNRPERFDLFNHLSAGELFFVDLDSLIVEAMCNSHVDWEYPQVLLVSQIVRHLLEGYRTRGGNFHVIEFECNRVMWSQTPTKNLIRSVIARQLQELAASNNFIYKKFKNWWDESTEKKDDTWKAYLKRWGPEFVVVNDGEQLVGSTPAEIGGPLKFSLIQDDKKASAVASKHFFGFARHSEQGAVMFRSFLMSLIADRIHAVYSSRQVYKDNAIVGFVIRAHSSKFQPLTDLLPCAQKWWTDLKVVKPDDVTSDDAVAGITAAFDCGAAINTRELASILALRDVLKDSPALAELAQAYLITLIIQREATLDLRAQSAPIPDCRDYSAFISQLATPLCHWFAVLEADTESDVDASLVDILDARFFLVVSSLLTQASSIQDDVLANEEQADALKKLWRFVTNDKKAKIDAVPKLPALGDAPTVAALNTSDQQASWKDNGFHPMLSKLVPAPGNFDPSSLEDNHDGPLTGWLELDPLANFDEPPGLAEVEREKRDLESKSARAKTIAIKKANKLKSRMMASIQQTAASMGNIAFLADNEASCIVEESDPAKVEEERQKRILEQKLRAGETTSTTEGQGEAPKKDEKKKKQKKKELTNAEKIKRQNILSSANKELVKEETKLENLLRQKTVEELSKFVDLCKLPWRRLLADRPETQEEADRQKKAWKLFVSTFKASSSESEFEFIFKKDTKGAYNVINNVEKFVKQELAEFEEMVPELDEDEKITYIRALYLREFENQLKYRASANVCDIYLHRWINKRAEIVAQSRTAEADEYELPIQVFQTAHAAYKIIQRSGIRVRTVERDILRRALQYLDLPDTYLRMVDDRNREWEGESSPFQALPSHITNSDEKPALRDTAARFQLLRMGHLLARPRPSETDNRVPFNPDDWQRDLLDIVDRRGSAVVCAPTSAGKTFISYYCMKNVLRTSNQNIVVYVAPTRALINQAMADVYSRFGTKEYPREAAVKVYGCLGGADFVRDPFDCQVLITLPETFEALLLSPKFQTWSQRIKYVIFDEIHSIDNGNNGDVWERLLMRVRCPFVALSATIGETHQLVDWLNRVQDRLEEQGVSCQENRVHMIPFGGKKIQRWSDIEKHAYLPQKLKAFKKLRRDGGAEYSDAALLPIHPMSCVTVEMLQTKFPEDLPFVPRESVELHEIMCKLFKQEDGLFAQFSDIKLVQSINEVLKKTDPDRYFAKELTITQSRGREYERELKAEVLRWGAFSVKEYGDFSPKELKDKADKKLLHKLITALVVDLVGYFSANVKLREDEVIQQITEKSSSSSTGGADGANATPAYFPDTMEYVQESMLNALNTLQRQKKLPAIVFSFEEDDCNRLVQHVVDRLERAEEEYRKTDEFKEYERKIKAKAEAHKKDLKTQKSFEGKKLETGEDGKVQAASQDGRVEGVDESIVYEVPEILPEFTFASTFGVVSAQDMKDIEFDMSKDDLVLRAFKRGIGIHHTGVKGKIRIHFERLFRTKYLPVIFATQTLALGVHSPCRSVILAGDHTELNTMQFRQMAGRAGRRGQDFSGHTIFMGVPFRKIQRLMTSDLNVLKGHVQIDCVSQLRLQQLHDHEPDASLSTKEKKAERERKGDLKEIQNLVECLMQEPLFFHGRKSTRDYKQFQVAHAAHSLAFFQKMGLKFAGEDPKTQGSVATLGAMVTRPLNMYKETYLGNSAFLCANFMKNGTFDRISSQWATESGDNETNRNILKAMLNCFAYIFSINSERSLPLEIHRSVLRDPSCFVPEGSNVPKCPHNVVLPGLRTIANKTFLSDWERYNKDVLFYYSHLLAYLGEQEAAASGKKARSTLPLHVDGEGYSEKGLFPKKAPTEGIFKHLAKSKIPVSARSPFVAIAGVGDVFESVEDMVHSLRDKLFMDAALIPTVDLTDLHRHDKSQVLINSALVDYANNRMQVVNGKNRREYLERFNGMNNAASYSTLNKFCVAMDNFATAFERAAPHSHHENPDDDTDSYIRSAKGNLLACADPSCTINDREDFNRYNAKIIRGRVWRCMDAMRRGTGEKFICEDCRTFGEGTKGMKLQPYTEDPFADCIIQLAAHAEQWGSELREQDVYRKIQEEALAAELGMSSVSLAKRHIVVKFQ